MDQTTGPTIRPSIRPTMSAVTSSMLSLAGYDHDSQIFYARFPNGSTWRYFDVTPEENAAFWSAESQGKYFTANIKSKKKGESV